jgi:SM-20-related protein
MATLGQAAGFDLLLIEGFFDAPTCARILGEMRAAQSGPATVYTDKASGVVDSRVRRATRVLPSPETTEFVIGRLLERRAAVEEHFRVSLSGCEEPQFLRYGAGDFFVAHQDGNTGMIRSERELSRRVSVSIFLSRWSESPEPGAYCGGSLIFHRWGVGAGSEDSHLSLNAEAGTLVAFRPETTHEVIPVTHGERHSIACWYR